VGGRGGKGDRIGTMHDQTFQFFILNPIARIYFHDCPKQLFHDCRYGMAISSRNSPVPCSMNRGKLAGAFMSTNGILTHSYDPHGVTNAVKCQLDGSTNPW